MSASRTGLLHIPTLDQPAGDAIRCLLHASLPGAVVLQESYAASQRHWIEETLRRWCDEEELDLVLTLGGTLPAPGPGNRELTPEATLAVVERLLPGLPEAMRAWAQEATPLALIDRGVAGIRGRSLILNLPAGAGEAAHFLEAVVEVLPPILAHLHDDPDAATLAHALGEAVQAGDVEKNAPPAAQTKGSHTLDPVEFAAYLKRRKEDQAGTS